MVFRSKRVLNTHGVIIPVFQKIVCPWTTWVWTDRSTYMWILKISTAVLHDLWLVESVEADPQIQRVYCGTWTSINFGIHSRFWNKFLRDTVLVILASAVATVLFFTHWSSIEIAHCAYFCFPVCFLWNHGTLLQSKPKSCPEYGRVLSFRDNLTQQGTIEWLSSDTVMS